MEFSCSGEEEEITAREGWWLLRGKASEGSSQAEMNFEFIRNRGTRLIRKSRQTETRPTPAFGCCRQWKEQPGDGW